ncbi:adenylate/guanylate cyclase domain-containing protein [Bradyrhizobium sp. Tv2a-2]|uniref:adenylate/guanylate cyclase domain-containing protein n=1 Tax=Bradyrhizobium sp. Tv2a-2 TaxID=113395 RepID=UPI000465F514|nr:adenylate/guanylate cyclase domain-containing protein [Bradyrhizobium sp. Tv2a-2]
MQLPATLSWLVDEASATASHDRFLAELARRLVGDGLPLAGGALTIDVPDPIVARRTWLWRAASADVIEALGFGLLPSTEPRANGLDPAGHSWLAEIGNGQVHEHAFGSGLSAAAFGWIGARPFSRAEIDQLAQAARFAAAPLAALSARAMMSAALNAYLGKRSAARVLSGPLRRDFGETIQAALLFADLRGFTELSEAASAATVVATLNAWFDRIAGATHAFGGEVLKFIGDGMLAIFPVTDDSPGDACRAALHAVKAARAGMAHLNTIRQQQGLQPLGFGAALHAGDIFWGNIGAADRLDFTAIGPAVNLVSRLEGLCKPLNRSVLISGVVAAHADPGLIPLGAHALRGIASPCAVFALPDEGR